MSTKTVTLELAKRITVEESMNDQIVDYHGDIEKTQRKKTEHESELAAQSEHKVSGVKVALRQSSKNVKIQICAR